MRARTAGRAPLAHRCHHLTRHHLLRLALPGHSLFRTQAAPPSAHHPRQGEQNMIRGNMLIVSDKLNLRVSPFGINFSALLCLVIPYSAPQAAPLNAYNLRQGE
jgi:hypothetical protein